MEYQVNCPHCQAHMKSNKPLAAGKAIRCLKCRRQFSVRQIDQDTLVSVPFQAPPRRASSFAIWLLVGGFLVFLLAGAGLTIYCLELPDEELQADEQANENEPEAVLQDIEGTEPPHKKKQRPKTKALAGAELGKAADKTAKLPQKTKLAQPAKTAQSQANKPVKSDKPLSPAPVPGVAAALARGVAFLEKHYGGKDLTQWSQEEVRSARADPTGFLALTGLTLLECGVHETDPLIAAAHRAVLLGVGRVDRTYDLGLAILFLDRLRKKQDEEVIERVALQLIVRQNPDGGWPYNCPPLNAGGGKQLLRFLRENRLALRELAHPKEFLIAIPGGKQKLSESPERQPGKDKSPSTEEKPAVQADAKVEAGTKAQPRFRADQLPPGLQHLPVVTQAKATPQQPGGANNRSDNSNTQFAMLGLWIAQKHGIPMERTFNLVDQRFRHSQAADGSWTYTANENPVPPAMTCAGLLGLAVGHGSAQQVATGGDAGQSSDADARSITDPLIQNGLGFLGRTIGTPVPTPNTYLLWSIERVAVLYHLDTIGGKDWYSWGARALVDSQRNDGSWFFENIYTAHSPVIDTCFALLFLKKADFVPNLGRELRQYIRVRDPGSE